MHAPLNHPEIAFIWPPPKMMPHTRITGGGPAAHVRSKRSAFITLTQAATKSLANFS